MPWLLKRTAYIETDILKMPDDSSLTDHLKRVVKSYEEHCPPDMQPLNPPVEEVMPLIAELDELIRISGYDDDEEARELLKRKPALLKELKPKVRQWGLSMGRLVSMKKIAPHRTGFPYLMLNYMHRPASVTSFAVQRDPATGVVKMSCDKKPALLLFFYWQASEDKLNWFTIGCTSQPCLKTRKLDPNKRYYYRMYMKNPKGKSDIHERGWEKAM